MLNINPIQFIFTFFALRTESKEAEALTKLFIDAIEKKGDTEDLKSSTASLLSEKNVQFLNRIRTKRPLKRVAAKLERAAIAFFQLSKSELSAEHLQKLTSLQSYQALKNLDTVERLAACGIPKKFLHQNHKFFQMAHANYWHFLIPYLPKLDLNTTEGSNFQIPVQDPENRDHFVLRSCDEIMELVDLDKKHKLLNYRLTERGLVIGGRKNFDKIEPLKEVISDDKCVIQLMNVCPRSYKLPSALQFSASGHSMTQVIIPSKEGRDKAKLHTLGFYPEKYSEVAKQPLVTAKGIYQSNDSNVTRILGGYNKGVTKQYKLVDDNLENLSLYSVLLSCESPRFSKSDLYDAFAARDKQKLKEIKEHLLLHKESISKKESKAPQFLSKEDKARAYLELIESVQDRQSYHMVEANCTHAQIETELFIKTFLGAKADFKKENLIEVYPDGGQCAISSIKVTLFDKIKELFARIILTSLSASPLGYFAGRGCVLDADKSISNWWSATKLALRVLIWPYPLSPATAVIHSFSS